MGSDIGKNINNRNIVLNCSGYSPREMCFVFGAYWEADGMHWIKNRDCRCYIVDPATIEKADLAIAAPVAAHN